MLKNKILSADGSGEEKLYSNDVFSAYLRAGIGADAVVNTGIDMTKGYMLWSKSRSAATDHAVYDSARGVTLDLVTNSTAAQTTQATGLKAVSSTGHTVGSLAKMNTYEATYVDFVFRKAPKFFDIVTYTGNGVAGRQIPHSLGVAPGMVIVKRVDDISNWGIYHTVLGGTQAMNFTTNAASATSSPSTYWNNTNPTSTHFVVGTGTAVNTNGAAYVAYLFAHDPSADGIIQCRSFTTDASGNATVNLGWEPQWIMIKRADAAGDWIVIDSMRGCSVGGVDAVLNPNLANAESVSNDYIDFTATGFITKNLTGTYIYTVIRRPNKPPTTGTEVYSSSIASGVINTGFPVDLHIGATRSGATNNHAFHDRLRGGTKELVSSSTAAETAITDLLFDSNTGLRTSFAAGLSNHFFKRTQGFFDIVYYTGDGSIGRWINHSLSIAPSLMFIKRRDGAGDWRVFWSGNDGINYYLSLNNNVQSVYSNGYWGNYPTQTMFKVNSVELNTGGATYAAYLFDTLPGISKVDSYIGNGTSKTINCGFTTGARFILIKRTDLTGDWFTWDSARGIVAANDPHLSLNTTAAEVTTDDSVDPDVSGFIVNQNTATNINVSGGSYIFLAIA